MFEQDQHKHVPVLLAQILPIAYKHFVEESPEHNSPTLKFWDGTLGMGGHSSALLQMFAQAELFASDHDQEMLALSLPALHEKFGARVTAKQANYAQNPFAQHAPFDLILLDLGVSSLHYDFFERGFTFRHTQKLDMRMDTSLSLTAALWLAHAKEEEISQILFRYGDEKKSRAIAKKICHLRKQTPIENTEQLKQICESCYPAGFAYRGRSHADRYPAVRTFQAIRIFINNELENLRQALEFLPDLLTPRGLLCVISFHSLEDKLVKNAFHARSRSLDTSARAREFYKKGDFEMWQNKAIMAGEDEIEENARARSARLRILRRI